MSKSIYELVNDGRKKIHLLIMARRIIEMRKDLADSTGAVMFLALLLRSHGAMCFVTTLAWLFAPTMRPGFHFAQGITLCFNYVFFLLTICYYRVRKADHLVLLNIIEESGCLPEVEEKEEQIKC